MITKNLKIKLIKLKKYYKKKLRKDNYILIFKKYNNIKKWKI